MMGGLLGVRGFCKWSGTGYSAQAREGGAGTSRAQRGMQLGGPQGVAGGRKGRPARGELKTRAQACMPAGRSRDGVGDVGAEGHLLVIVQQRLAGALREGVEGAAKGRRWGHPRRTVSEQHVGAGGWWRMR